MKTYNAQIEKVKELLQNIVGVAVGYDGFSEKYRLISLIDDMSGWACEALKILEELPRDSRGKDGIPIVDASEIHSILKGQLVCTCNTTDSWCPIHGAKK